MKKGVQSFCIALRRKIKMEKDGIETIITCIMIVLLCIASFGIGYYQAYDKAVTETNEFIQENCIMKFDVTTTNFTNFQIKNIKGEVK